MYLFTGITSPDCVYPRMLHGLFVKKEKNGNTRCSIQLVLDLHCVLVLTYSSQLFYHALPNLCS